MNEGWYVLALCILSSKYINPETALECFELARKPNRNRVIDEADIDDMIKMRKEMTFKAIAGLYGLSMDAARRRILRKQGVMV